MRHVVFDLHELRLRVEGHGVDAGGRRVTDVRRHLGWVGEDYASGERMVLLVFY